MGISLVGLIKVMAVKMFKINREETINHTITFSLVSSPDLPLLRFCRSAHIIIEETAIYEFLLHNEAQTVIRGIGAKDEVKDELPECFVLKFGVFSDLLVCELFQRGASTGLYY